jgi:hypothetical protein
MHKMKISPQIFGVLAIGWAAALTLPQSAFAVTDEEFKALRDLVIKQGQKLDELEQKHIQDQQIHQQDQQKIELLQRQLGETQVTVTNAMEKADAAAAAQAAAQPGPPATHNVTLAGDAEVIFGRIQGQHSAFALADYAPIFLYRGGDKVLFEAGFDFMLSDGSGSVANSNAGTSYNFDLSFATIDYLLNDYATLVAGNMLLPLGTYSERSAGWLNKFPDNPLPRGLVPGNGVGAQLRGAIPIGNGGQMFTYSVYGVNGPSATDNTGAFGSLDLGGNVGILSNSRYGGATTFDSLGNIHSDPTGGGRIGWFYPWKAHYDVELGLSGQSGEWNELGNNYSALVVDGALHFSPAVEVKGEYIRNWVQSTDMGTVRSDGWWIQGGYKLSGMNLDWPAVNNLELMGRYDTSGDMLGAPDSRTRRGTLGFVYYFTNTLLFETDYEWLHNTGSSASLVPRNELLCQISYGF